MSYKKNGLEKLLWSIAIPGFGQLLNQKYVKGILLITLEIFINIKSNLNSVIIYSFYGDIDKAIENTNYTWLLFYPCLYFFAIWDAYRDAVKDHPPFLFIPFVLAAYFSTIGVIYSRSFKLIGILLGPIWLSLIFAILGLAFGIIMKKLLIRKYM